MLAAAAAAKICCSCKNMLQLQTPCSICCSCNVCSICSICCNGSICYAFAAFAAICSTLQHLLRPAESAALCSICRNLQNLLRFAAFSVANAGTVQILFKTMHISDQVQMGTCLYTISCDDDCRMLHQETP